MGNLWLLPLLLPHVALPSPEFKGSSLVSDRATGTSSAGATAGTQLVAWSDGYTWEAAQPAYAATLNDNALVWNHGPAWTVVSLVGVVPQTLAVTQVYEQSVRYSRTQGGTLMPETYLARGLSLTESTTGDKGTYDPSTGQITWLKADGSASMGPWARSGAPPQRQGQMFRFTDSQGHNVLYLHGNGSMSGLNSRGPGRSSTCLAKIPLDLTQPVTHVSIQRPHKWIQQCPGTLSNLSVSLWDALGTAHRLSDDGQNLSFVLTWAPAD